MEAIVNDSPNLAPETVPVENVSSGLDSIAAKMAAMRNQHAPTRPTETGKEVPVAPSDITNSDIDSVNEPEVDVPNDEYEESNEEANAPEEVSNAESSSEDIIDFMDFANTNPNAKFKFVRNGKEIEIDAKKAASILGQGAAISEEARQLKIEKSEFSEYLDKKRGETEGLLLAMEFTVRPQLQKHYDEVIKTQGYQQTFQQQLSQISDPAHRARIQAGMQQNEKYISEQGQAINSLKPKLDEFYSIRKQQVVETLEANRKKFTDKELSNSYVYNEVKEKISKGWDGAKGQLVPGIDNIDLISADEHIISLLRDGLKYRDKPKLKSAGSSLAAVTTKRTSSSIASNEKDEMSKLQEKAKGGDKKAADNLLVAKMKALRAQRTR
jgi:hypothetical protein